VISKTVLIGSSSAYADSKAEVTLTDSTNSAINEIGRIYFVPIPKIIMI